ncbi:hypothetical protein FRC96_19085 [Lujinxingia vulgaris]|uniref:Uncharacterized protein n=1 Tax=Lujinxingia vulgaris TaxID=2600176 RepID=A0A5C6X473_9DELT|nr:hypothetical protein [Lujinxingia vulgaris]TXD32008.1 hypothetical protein FRC96_19085 [Lujinxingia vulgaris]
MMDGMGRFEALLSSGSRGECAAMGAPVCETVGALASYMRAEGRLRTRAAWELDEAEAMRLAQVSGVVPEGGWVRFVGLCAGAGVLVARGGGFEAGPKLKKACAWSTPELEQRLVEGFTRWLVPPATAASWFVALGVHPLWGLKLARQVHREGALLGLDPGREVRDDAILGARRLEGVRRHVFVSLAVVVGVLRRLTGERIYEVGALTRLVEEAMRFARVVAYDDDDEDAGQLQVVVEEVCWRAAQHAVWALMDEVLVPAGVVRWDIGRGIAVRARALERVRVGALGVGAQDTWVRLFLSGSGGRKVA